MTVTELRAELAAMKAKGPLYRRVINEIMRDTKDYEGENFSEKLKGRLDDIAMGLSSGVVGSLIYYSDTCKFFKRYEDEIIALLTELCNDTGLQPAELLKDFDKDDPFCRDTHNQNLLAWFAYEEIANQIASLMES